MDKTSQKALKSLEEIAGELISSINLNRLSVGEVIIKYQSFLKNYVENYNLTNSQAREVTKMFCAKMDGGALAIFSKRIETKIGLLYPD